MIFYSRFPFISGLVIAGLLFSGPVVALDSDKDAPVSINADTTDIDFRTGKRVLTGNVDVSQGTLNIKADKIVLIYKGEGDKCECCNSRCISQLTTLRKLYWKLIINRTKNRTDDVLKKKQCGFRSGTRCVDQLFVVMQLCEKFWQTKMISSRPLWP